jgi:hypothetical protein
MKLAFLSNRTCLPPKPKNSSGPTFDSKASIPHLAIVHSWLSYNKSSGAIYAGRLHVESQARDPDISIQLPGSGIEILERRPQVQFYGLPTFELKEAANTGLCLVSTSTGTNLNAVLLACAGFYAGLSFGLLLASFLRDWVPSRRVHGLSTLVRIPLQRRIRGSE